MDTYVLLMLLQEQVEADFEADMLEDNLLATSAFVIAGAELSRDAQAERRAQTRTYLTRAELLPNPRESSPWQSLFASRNDRAFITTMGLDVDTFHHVLGNGFSLKWDTCRIPRSDTDHTRGIAEPRPSRRSLDAAGGLGLILHYYNSTMSDTSLCQIFALTPTTVSRYIDFAMGVLLETLRSLPAAAVRWPTGADAFQELNDYVIAKYPRLTGAFRTMDGLNVPVQESADEIIENQTYNGWLHAHFVSLVIAFATTGEIIGSRFNAPGSWHDSRIARPIYEKLEKYTPEGYYLVTDTAFPRGTDRIKGKIRAPMKVNAKNLPDKNSAQYHKLVAEDRELVGFRQSAEWGMRAIQGSFGRLRIPLPIQNAHRRSSMLESCLRLHQVRVRKVGINQVHTVYVKYWTEDLEQRRIFNEFKSIVFGEQIRADRVSKFHLEARYE
ncbi:hypothetical protein FISHEDRAFT_45080 [Fistulina hepatica ATCC 64428]|uniref:DDE Tnp4 domain-containing protein n=1 Tax=Fistulina hepatica ATCC 64428 TaxID=1128425 RepID=A0A0D7AA60_9AGAR|nr:hypothetical protein FISHEDRAFT_45080 [Fistulina hepatica ATCC 64428]